VQGLGRLENNEMDIMPDVSYTEERSKLYDFSNEIVLASWSRVYAREGADIQSILDLEGKNIAVLRGSVNVEGPDGIKVLVAGFGINCTFTELDSYTKVFELVESKKADAGVTNKDFGNRYETDFDVQRTPIMFQPSHIQFAFPKKSSLTPYLIERIDYHMKQLKEDEDSIYYQSLEKWLAVKPEEKPVIAGWVKWALAGMGGLALLLGGGSFILRSQVRYRTKELAEAITDRKQAQERIEHLNLVLRAIRNVNQIVIREKDRNRLMQSICDNLIETRGYYNAWIALLDKAGEFVTATETGLGKDFLPLLERLERRQLTACGQRALKQPGVVAVKDPLTACADCALSDKYASRGAMTVRLEHGGKLYGLLSTSIPKDLTADKEEQSVFREVAADIAFALHNIELEEKRKRAEEKLERMLEGVIQALGRTTEMRDPYTAGHQRRVTKLACAVAEQMKVSPEQIEAIRIASLMHDIGKISVPADILSKPSRLTDIEFGLIKAHPQTAYDILKEIDFPWPVADIVLQHHERMDGSGYPQGLKGDEILLEARIIAVADVVEAMASHRPYRPALGIDEALGEIRKNKGRLYDPQAVEACLRLFDKGFQFGVVQPPGLPASTDQP